MSPEQKQKRQAIFDARHQDQNAVVELLSRSYVEDSPKDSLIWTYRGHVLTELCRYEEADVAFEQALQNAPETNHHFIWSEKADSFFRRGNFLEAERCWHRYLQSQPNDCWVLILLARTVWRRGDLALAEQRLREAIATQGEESDLAWFFLGGVFVALGQLEEAANCYREALALSPDYEIAKARLADVETALQIKQRN